MCVDKTRLIVYYVIIGALSYVFCPVLCQLHCPALKRCYFVNIIVQACRCKMELIPSLFRGKINGKTMKLKHYKIIKFTMVVHTLQMFWFCFEIGFVGSFR